MSSSGTITKVRRDLHGQLKVPPVSSKSKMEPAELVGTYGQGIVEDERCNRKVCPT